ncbi:hypothetical protein D1BOALGB6SA_3273 [Olavius sp. associated proteobacterium Delta 1]|nr:hypothetical protein D1BOALGB6SA_3273 [Olavius sp. associated proteobacterium Delta 1]
MYDFIVIGGGPSGCLTAYLLAQSGFHVALFERKKFPRKKLCGGGVSYKASKLIEKIVDLSNLKGRVIEGSYLSYKNRHLTYVGQDKASYSIHRSEFDNELLSKAKMMGCEVHMPSKVFEIEERSKEICVKLNNGSIKKSGFLILAEGITGNLYRHI